MLARSSSSMKPTHRYMTRLVSKQASNHDSAAVRISLVESSVDTDDVVADVPYASVLHVEDVGIHIRPGTRLRVYWASAREWYPCTVIDLKIMAETAGSMRHVCEYEGGIVEHVLSSTRFEVLEKPPSDTPSLERVRVRRMEFNSYSADDAGESKDKYYTQLKWLTLRESEVSEFEDVPAAASRMPSSKGRSPKTQTPRSKAMARLVKDMPPPRDADDENTGGNASPSPARSAQPHQLPGTVASPALAPVLIKTSTGEGERRRSKKGAWSCLLAPRFT